MRGTLTATSIVVAAVALLGAPASARAQAAIAGTVKDTTGAVLPGVTVEASSPALIEKVRSAVTDATGEYKIVELVPGTYSVTFTLGGFSALKREGIQLPSNFTANVSVEMRVGNLEETLTVSGASPVVDVQNVRQSTVMNRDTVDVLPTAKQFQDLAQLIPAVARSGADVGGQLGQSFHTLSAHGGRGNDMRLQVDGMGVESATTPGSTGGIMFQDADVEEYTFEVGGSTAESETGGIRVNMIPRAGGNTPQGVFFGNISSPDLAANNITDELRALGVRDPNKPKELWLASSGFGGPIRRDRLWSYTSASRMRADSYISGAYYNLTPNGRAYTPDFTDQAVRYDVAVSLAERLTWQVTPKNKITGYYNYSTMCNCTLGVSPTVSPEATYAIHYYSKIWQATWSAPMTNRLLFEAGAAYIPEPGEFNRQPDGIPGGNPLGGSGNRIIDVGTGYTWGSKDYNHTFHDENNRVYRASMSYVTGSHATKVGFSFMTIYKKDFPERNTEAYTLVNGVPNSITYYPNIGGNIDDPTRALVDIDNIRPKGGFFVQDQWTLKRMTINGGLRVDIFRQSYPEQTYPATPIIPVPRTYAALEQGRWNDLSPRLSVAYDLFGTGRTALKASVSKYAAASFVANGPGRQSAGITDTRRWTDTNNNFAVDGDPTNPAANGELGPRTNGIFGTNVPPQRFDPDWYGWNRRPGNNWEFSAGGQHELLPGVSLNAAYFRRVYTSFQVTDNQALSPADFDPFCVTTPIDPRLPGGGGQQVCGLYDLKPSKVGLSAPVVGLNSKFGDQFNHWNGVDVTLSAKLPRGTQVQGGISGGKTMTDNCAIVRNYPEVTSMTDLQISAANTGALTITSGVTSPTQFCHVDTPYLWTAKAFGSYALPWGFQVSGTIQNLPGPLINGVAVFSSAQVAESLGRPLSAAASIRVNVVPPATLFGDRTTQLDFRFAKTFSQIDRARIRAMVDLYNALNASSVLGYNDTYGTNGATWQRPTAILASRLVKFAVQVDF